MLIIIPSTDTFSFFFQYDQAIALRSCYGGVDEISFINVRVPNIVQEDQVTTTEWWCGRHTTIRGKGFIRYCWSYSWYFCQVSTYRVCNEVFWPAYLIRLVYQCLSCLSSSKRCSVRTFRGIGSSHLPVTHTEYLHHTCVHWLRLAICLIINNKLHTLWSSDTFNERDSQLCHSCPYLLQWLGFPSSCAFSILFPG